VQQVWAVLPHFRDTPNPAMHFNATRHRRGWEVNFFTLERPLEDRDRDGIPELNRYFRVARILEASAPKLARKTRAPAQLTPYPDKLEGYRCRAELRARCCLGACLRSNAHSCSTWTGYPILGFGLPEVAVGQPALFSYVRLEERDRIDLTRPQRSIVGAVPSSEFLRNLATQSRHSGIGATSEVDRVTTSALASATLRFAEE
jgi:hypothetical protein